MSRLDERISITCPLAQAKTRLSQFFRAHGNADGDTARLILHIDVGIPGLSHPVTIERSVIATIQPHRIPGDMEPRYRLQWAPEVSGPLPLFAGELWVGGAADYDSFTLHLAGDYTPPLGLIGKGFDATIGYRVAAGTANNLLHRIRDEIEQAFRADEEHKRVV